MAEGGKEGGRKGGRERGGEEGGEGGREGGREGREGGRERGREGVTGDCSSWIERPHTGTFSLAAALSVRVIELEEAAGQAALRPAPDVARLDPGSDECAHTITLIHSTPYALLRGGRGGGERGRGGEERREGRVIGSGGRDG